MCQNKIEPHYEESQKNSSSINSEELFLWKMCTSLKAGNRALCNGKNTGIGTQMTEMEDTIIFEEWKQQWKTKKKRINSQLTH